MDREKPLIALLTNHDDDVYCFRKELIEGLILNGYKVLVSCPYGEKMKLMKGISFIYDNLVIDRRGKNIKNDMILLMHYFSLLKKTKPDVILTYTAKPNIYGSIIAICLKIPVINNVTGFGSVLNQSYLMKAFIMKLFRFVFTRSACIMFQNKYNMQLAKKNKMIKGEYKLIPGSGVNVDRFPLQPYPKGGDGSTGEKVVFNYIGRILHDKGVDDYIEAAKRIKKKYPKTEFNMIGLIEKTESHYEKDLDELEKQKIIFYRGEQKDVRPFIKRAHAIIHPSVYGEGMSNVLLENASSGRPIITTDNPGCKETVENSVTGFIFHGGKVDELVDRIETFLLMNNNERKNMGIKGRERMKKYFSRQIVVDTYIKKITEIIG